MAQNLEKIIEEWKEKRTIKPENVDYLIDTVQDLEDENLELSVAVSNAQKEISTLKR